VPSGAVSRVAMRGRHAAAGSLRRTTLPARAGAAVLGDQLDFDRHPRGREAPLVCRTTKPGTCASEAIALISRTGAALDRCRLLPGIRLVVVAIAAIGHEDLLGFDRLDRQANCST
jgi:hypothetical protein